MNEHNECENCDCHDMEDAFVEGVGVGKKVPNMEFEVYHEDNVK